MSDNEQLQSNIVEIVTQVLRQREATSAGGPTVAEAFKLYAKAYLTTKKSGEQMGRALRRILKPYWSRPLGNVTRADVRAILEPFKRRGGASHHNFHRAVISGLFSWAQSEDLATINPVVGIKAMKTTSRDVVLTDDQLRKVWEASLKIPHGNLIRMLILTGQRRSEIGGLRWDQVSLANAEVSIEGKDFKTGKPHSYPLAPMAKELLRRCQMRDCDGELKHNKYIFGQGRVAISFWTHIVYQLRSETGDIGEWVLHDLRRTMRTRLDDIGIASADAERLLGHALRGIEGTYNRGQAMARKRMALELWEAYLIVNGIAPSDAAQKVAAGRKLEQAKKRLLAI